MDDHQSPSFEFLDLRGTPCPVNFIRCKLAMEELDLDQSLKVELDKGDPEYFVISGLREAGHEVQIISDNLTCLTIMVRPIEICG